MHADPSHDEQPGRVLAHILQDLLEGFAVEQCGLDLDALIARERLGHAQMRFVNLRQAGVDDLLVQLLLLFEAEDLRGLGREHVDDPIEHGVVKVGVIDRHGLDRLAERATKLDGGAKARE